jgi:ATP-dependent Lhr-like helicase
MGFDRLHPSIQHHVVNSLGWRVLRPLQEQSIDPILDKEHCLLIAPTAGGKTEAAFLPVLSRMLKEEWRGLSVLYVCPIRALLNNLEERLSYYCSLVGRRCGLWHGDVGQAPRASILREPPDVLLTTPESLEAILISRRTDRNHFFGSLRTLIIDEIHSFAADDRGWHLLAVSERIAALASQQPQRIGLSATIGNPRDILAWMTRGEEPARVVSPVAKSGGGGDAEVRLDYVGSIENAALVIAQLHRGEKRLVFSDSRSQAERLASLLRSSGVTTYVSHSSLSVDDRRQAERAFRDSRDCVIVATSTLELGIDVGDLDRVLQLETPSTVASFLQRLGRTGRRPGSVRNCLFLSTHRESLVASAALLRLWRSGFVEPLQSPALPYPVIAQQIMALIRQKGGASRGRFDDSTIQRALGQSAEVTESLLEHMLEQGIVFEDSGILGVGPSGERLYGAKNFMPLMSVFDTPSLFQVMCGAEELGWVHPLSFSGFGTKRVVISLGGRSWEVLRLDEEHSIAHVRAAESPGRSRWLGGSRALSRVFCEAVRSVLLDDQIDPNWSRRAQAELMLARTELSEARTDGLVVETNERNGQMKWWTFGGLRANYSLALMMRTKDGVVPRFDNFFVEIPNVWGLVETERLLQSYAERDSGSQRGVHTDPPGRVKFWDCLPLALRRAFTEARLTDWDGAEEILNKPRIHASKSPA